MTTAISTGWPDLIVKCHSILLRYCHLSLTGQFGIMEAPSVLVINSFRRCHFGCFPLCQRFRKFRLEVKWEGFVWGPSDRNILEHFSKWSRISWSEFCNRNFPFHFDKPVRCPTSLHLCREFGKRTKNGKNHSSWLAGFVGKCRSIFLGHLH